MRSPGNESAGATPQRESTLGRTAGPTPHSPELVTAPLLLTKTGGTPEAGHPRAVAGRVEFVYGNPDPAARHPEDRKRL